VVPPLHSLIPSPVEFDHVPGEGFRLEPGTPIAIDGDAGELGPVADELGSYVRRANGSDSPVGRGDQRGITLSLASSSELGREGYTLDVDKDSARLAASSPAGLFWGVQTLRQLLELSHRPFASLLVPAVHVADYPRFAWRGAMLDVARHFMPVEAVKRYIDLMVLYKMNILHLHLSDDQGWRIFIDTWPRLAEYGGSLEIGGPPGYYTKPDLSDIVSYAAAHHVTVVPEIDTPAHAAAAIASYPELGGQSAAFGSLSVDKDATYRFLDDVVREVCQLTPGEYFHIGGDEASGIPARDYLRFVSRAGQIVRAHGKKMVGWHEIARADLAPDEVVQYWGNPYVPAAATLTRAAVKKGAKVVLSPSDRVYLDMKYDRSTRLGLSWAGFVDVHRAYDWDPATLIEGVSEGDVLGVEAPLWGETITDIRDAEFMSFPRLAGVAEIGWSPAGRSWDEYRVRLAAHGEMWDAMRVTFHRSPEIPWRGPSGSAR
jgi:hexosaminidase